MKFYSTNMTYKFSFPFILTFSTQNLNPFKYLGSSYSIQRAQKYDLIILCVAYVCMCTNSYICVCVSAYVRIRGTSLVNTLRKLTKYVPVLPRPGVPTQRCETCCQLFRRQRRWIGYEGNSGKPQTNNNFGSPKDSLRWKRF